jgi:hypothetical protein
MEFELNQALEVLSGTPAVLTALLRDKSEPWLTSRKAPESFSPIDVVGHLILADQTDWMPRVQTILAHRDTRPFDPFDRFAFQPLIQGRPITELLDDFASIRHRSLQTLKNLGLEKGHFELPGLHPDLGLVTLGNLLATWVVHDLGHISQITKAMASAYAEAVGPWSAYLSVLK